MTISGTSTLHDWVSEVTQINFEGKVLADNQNMASINIEEVSLSIPVLGIKSTKGKGMDKKTYDALKSEEHANIECKLSDFSIKQTGNSYTIDANGQLTIAGMTKTLSLNLTAQFTEHGTLLFKGRKALKMTDFNIKPPKALLGTLKTGDDITIDFTVSMKAGLNPSN